MTKNIRSLHATTINQLEQVTSSVCIFNRILHIISLLLQCNKLRCHLKILESPLKFGDLFHQVIRRRQGETKIRPYWLINGDSKQSDSELNECTISLA